MGFTPDPARAILEKHAVPVQTALLGFGELLLVFMAAASCPELAVFASVMQPIGTLLLVAAVYESLKIIACEKGIHTSAYEAFAVPILSSVWLTIQSLLVHISAGVLEPEVMMAFIVIGGIVAFIVGNIVVLFGMARRGGGAAGLVGALFTILVIPAGASAFQFARLGLR